MTSTEEFSVKDKNGKVLILQHVKKGLSYLDFGMHPLPRDYEGYMVKYSDRPAQKLADGSFKVADTDSVFSRA